MEDKQDLPIGGKREKKMSSLERKLVRMGMGAAVIGSALLGNIRPAEGKSSIIDISGSRPGTPVELMKKELQTLSSLPTATLTEGENKALAETFPDAKGPQFTNVFSNVSVDNAGRVNGLPFEKDSNADKLAQSYQAIIAAAAQFGGAPEILVGRNIEKNTIAIIVRNTQPFIAKEKDAEKAYKANSFLFIDQTNSFGYLEPTPRSGGDKDFLKLFAVDKAFQDNVERFYIGPKENPQKLEAPPIGEFTVAQVDEKENAQVVVISGFAIPLFDTGDSSIPKATPEPGTSSDLPTPVAPEVRAKVVAPEKSGWDLKSDKAPILGAGIMEIIKDGKEKAVIIPNTAIAVSVAELSQDWWDNYDEALKKALSDPRYLKILGLSKPLDIKPTHDLIIYPSELTGKTDKQTGDIITDFVKGLRINLRSLDYLDRQAKVVSIEPNKLQPQMAILFFDYSDSDQKISEFYKKKFGFDISADDASKLKWTTAGFPQTRVFEGLRVYDEKTNTEFMLVSIPTDSYDLISRMFDAIVVANTTNTKDIKVGMRTDAAEKMLNVFSIKCKGVDKNAHIYGLLGSTAGIELIQTICKK